MSDGISPEWSPPSHLTAPYVRRLAVDRAKWTRTVRGRLGHPTRVGVGLALAGYGNQDGTRCRPGTDRLAADLQTSTRTIERVLAALDNAGWITRSNPGETGRGWAIEWQLTIPAPTAVDLGWWDTETNGAQWMPRPDRARPGHAPTPKGRRKVDRRSTEGRQTGRRKVDKREGERSTPMSTHQGSTTREVPPFRLTSASTRPAPTAAKIKTPPVRKIIAGLNPAADDTAGQNPPPTRATLDRIASNLWRHTPDDGTPRYLLRKRLASPERHLIDDALDHATTAGWLHVDTNGRIRRGATPS